MDVWRAEIRIVHGADANEPNGGTGFRVITPNRHPATWAARDVLAFPARGWCPEELRLAGGMDDTIGFKESVERMHGAGLPLTPTAMASMNNQRRSDQTISDLPAGASAFHVRLH